MESTVGWAQLKLRFINRRAAKVGSNQTAEVVSNRTAIIAGGLAAAHAGNSVITALSF